MFNRWAFCECLSGPRPFKAAVADLFEEIGEFLWKPSFDEASDICFAFGRLVGSVIGEQYIRIPGDSMCLEKLRWRLHVYGCVRSPRHPQCGRRR
jgi:hypothetical protein